MSITRTRLRRLRLAGVVAATAGVVLTGCTGTPTAAPATSRSTTVSSVAAETAPLTTTTAAASTAEVALASAPAAVAVEVKAGHGLWVTQAEHDAISRVLADCGATAPAAVVPPADTAGNDDATRHTTAAPAPAPVAAEPVYTPPPAPLYTEPPVTVEAPAPASTYYANCAAARAAGAAPHLFAGQPGYSSKLDRDGDGVACES